MKGRWGVLGGAFDPVHRGHLKLAGDIKDAKSLDGILFVPSFCPPHKSQTAQAGWTDRLKMLRLATEPIDEFEVSTIEETIDGPGFTLTLFRILKKEHPDVSFYFIIGADIIKEFDTWYKPDTILSEVDILVGSRPGDELLLPEKLTTSGKIELVETSLIDISSTAIRKQIQEGSKANEIKITVPDPVADYILSEALYK